MKQRTPSSPSIFGLALCGLLLLMRTGILVSQAVRSVSQFVRYEFRFCHASHSHERAFIFDFGAESSDAVRNPMRSFLHLLVTGSMLTMAAAQVPPRVANTTLQMPPEPFSSVAYELENLSPGGIGEPVAMVSPPADMRLFVVDRVGIIRVIPDLDTPVPEVFLDITDRVESVMGEEGLLGLAFHSDFATNGYFYVFYTRTNLDESIVHDDTLARFSVSATDPDRADSASESMMIRQEGDRWSRPHNGGDLHFGPDGYLYASLGDADYQNDAQRIDLDFKASLLRIDVDQRPGNLAPNPHAAVVGGYSIPADNPFVGATSFNGSTVDPAEVRGEKFAVGLRNPWRFSIDAVTGKILLGDVGGGSFEEINDIVSGGNYGWPFREGAAPQSGTPPAGVTLIDPLMAYGRDDGLSVIGGFVYRGSRLPELNGRYIFSDWGNAEIRAIDPAASAPAAYDILAQAFGFGPTAIAPDPRNGDILVCNNTGWGTSIHRLVRNESQTTDNLPATLSATGAFSDLVTLAPSAGVIPYEINVPFWSDDAIKIRWFSVPDLADTVGFDAEQPWAFPEGSVWIKHFEIEMTEGDPSSRRRLETRFLVKTEDNVYGVTYRWNIAETDATLVDEAGESEQLTRTLDGITAQQTWTYPSRASCLQCHTPDGGHALGFDTAQLNLSRPYDSETHNQIDALQLAGYLVSSPPRPRALKALAKAEASAASIEFRARSYLQANCAQCHDGSGVVNWDARLRTPLDLTGIIGGALNDSAGDPDNRVIAPGDRAHSMLLTRISTRGSGKMPPIASHLVDPDGVALITSWVDSLATYQDYETWSIAQGGEALPETGDRDGDGLSNRAEFLLGSDPLDSTEFWPATDRLEFDSSDRPRLHFPRPANRSFIVEYSDDLGSDWQFLDVPGNEPLPRATTDEAIVIDVTAGDAARRFYRVKLLDP
ncbi:MAG: putative repeat protein (TIGR03806 family) [Verrucomicrobiales bacterium]|jgi:uncharacterized repeat protein (TIGR03806 family)